MLYFLFGKKYIIYYHTFGLLVFINSNLELMTIIVYSIHIKCILIWKCYTQLFFFFLVLFCVFPIYTLEFYAVSFSFAHLQNFLSLHLLMSGTISSFTTSSVNPECCLVNIESFLPSPIWYVYIFQFIVSSVCEWMHMYCMYVCLVKWKLLKRLNWKGRWGWEQ